jgi:hypothetical protein
MLMPTIMPCFNSAPQEGDLIGRLLAGYGELEREMCDCVVAATNDLDGAIKTLFGVRGEKRRIDMADEMMGTHYDSAGLGPKHQAAIANMHWCREVRNQYAHCQWYYTPEEGLCFIDLEHTAKLLTKILKLTAHRYPIDAALLQRQEDYFHYVRECYWHLAEALRLATGRINKRSTAFQWPPVLARPPKHN